MRQLFLPACLCLVTWSGATSSGNSGPTLEEFSHGSLATKREISSSATPMRVASLETRGFALRDTEMPRRRSADVAIPQDETAHAVAAIPGDKKPALSVDEITALIPDLAAEFPVPSGVVVNNGIPEGIPLPPIPKPVVHRSEDEVCGTLTEAAQRNNLPAPFFIRLLFQESRFKPGAVSPVGAQGVAQFMPQTAELVGLDNPFDPLQAIPASARLLRDLVRQFGNLGLAAAAYNAGPKRVADWLAAKGKLPDETQGYVKTITGKPVENWSAASATHPPQKLPRQAPCQEAAGLLAWNGPDALPLPPPSPLRAPVKIAENKPAQKPAEKTAEKAEKTADKSVKVAPKTAIKSDDHSTAKLDEKPAAKTAVAQLAPRKRNPRNILPTKRQKIASR